MKIRFFSCSRSEVRKNGRRISFITHDLTSAYTLATPQISLAPQLTAGRADRRSKRDDA